MYTISRRDLPLAQQAIQAGHAALEHAYEFGRPPDNHPSYIHLTAKNKDALLKLKEKLITVGIPTAEFHEPYQEWGLTAIACCLNEEQRSHMKSLQLWRLPTQGETK